MSAEHCGRSSATYNVAEVCRALWEVLLPIYLRASSTADEWKGTAAGFQEQWNFPHCMGAIKGNFLEIIFIQTWAHNVYLCAYF